MLGSGAVQFALDYSFHALKSNSAILLGNSHSNPWIQPFENRIGLRWKYDNASGIYYPVDTWAPGHDENLFRATGEHAGEPPDGYAMIALLPNLAGTGNVLV